MDKITKEKYEFALAKVEELLPLVDDNTPANDKKALELSVMSDIVIAYEKVHFPTLSINTFSFIAGIYSFSSVPSPVNKISSPISLPAIFTKSRIEVVMPVAIT